MITNLDPIVVAEHVKVCLERIDEIYNNTYLGFYQCHKVEKKKKFSFFFGKEVEVVLTPSQIYDKYKHDLDYVYECMQNDISTLKSILKEAEAAIALGGMMQLEGHHADLIVARLTQESCNLFV